MGSQLNTKIATACAGCKITTVRLILGDQLNAQHSWYKSQDHSVLYVIAEIKEEASYVRHHIQKVCAFFAAMQHFATALKSAGHNVLHLTLDDTADYNDMSALVAHIFEQCCATAFEYQQPDEQRLHQLLSQCLLACEKHCYSTEHFLLEPEEFDSYITPAKHNRMEAFYRKMRKRFNILMREGKPEGGEWNYDSENRASLTKSDLNAIPEPLCFANDVGSALARIKYHNIATIGVAQENLLWPVNRRQANELLDYFCDYCLPLFGRFQDAMTSQSPHQWSLYHSRISFALNTKMITPRLVIARALAAYNRGGSDISLAQVEGFVRQILGWREYIRAVYWQNLNTYHGQNILAAKRGLPQYFWTGKTKMRCMAHAIGQSLDTAYAHHIQRLMITGNFCLLAGVSPDQVDEWYLGIYIDALEWVELPNTRGMSQWADGGWVATKPYCSSGNYINKMSDYCKGCHYDVKKKVGDGACPFNSLYWSFINRHVQQFSRIPRMTMVYSNWKKKDKSEQQAVLAQAANYLDNIESL